MTRMLSESDVTSTIIALIAKAEWSFETDHSTSKACIARAHALLKLERCVNQRFVARPDRGSLAPWQEQRVAAFIETHLGGRIGMPDLTAIARLSTSHFARAFKKTFGVAPFAYIARARIERAKRLMLETDLALSQVALECGMCDQSHFTRVFSRVVGESPNNWRRAHSTGEVFQPVPGVSPPERQQATACV